MNEIYARRTPHPGGSTSRDTADPRYTAVAYKRDARTLDNGLKAYTASTDIIDEAERRHERAQMNAERTQAYRRVVHTLSALGPSKLQNDEQDRIRAAADNLIFSDSLLGDNAAREALADVENLCRALVESGRWQEVTASRLAGDVFECGPGHPAEVGAAQAA